MELSSLGDDTSSSLVRGKVMCGDANNPMQKYALAAFTCGIFAPTYICTALGDSHSPGGDLEVEFMAL